MDKVRGHCMNRWHILTVLKPPRSCSPDELIELEEVVVDLLNRTIKLPDGHLYSLDALKRSIDYAVEKADLFIGKAIS